MIMSLDYRLQKLKPDGNLAFEVAAALDDHIEFHEGETVLRQTMLPATPGQRAVYSCYWYQYEVDNGGHRQFFENSTGILWDQAISGFILIGASEHVAILKAAVLLFPNGQPSKDRAERRDQVKRIQNEELEALDARLYNVAQEEDLDQIAADYINAHPEEFFLS
jgi:hypothetical protein